MPTRPRCGRTRRSSKPSTGDDDDHRRACCRRPMAELCRIIQQPIDQSQPAEEFRCGSLTGEHSPWLSCTSSASSATARGNLVVPSPRSLDGSAIPPERRQPLAAELGFSETVYIDDPDTAQLRIFTPAAELPFAGHPLVGTAWLLSRHRSDPVTQLNPPSGPVPPGSAATRCGSAHPEQPPRPGVSTTCSRRIRRRHDRPARPRPRRRPILGLDRSTDRDRPGPSLRRPIRSPPRTKHAAPPRCCSRHTSVAPSPSSTATDQYRRAPRA